MQNSEIIAQILKNTEFFLVHPAFWQREANGGAMAVPRLRKKAF
jgi:hypothetical protein